VVKEVEGVSTLLWDWEGGVLTVFGQPLAQMQDFVPLGVMLVVLLPT
jgi:hypothetical protein